MNIYDCLILLPLLIVASFLYWDLFTWKSDLFDPVVKD
jgi:hypothetical protein